ncbi:hypothetical protein [Micromonospora sp. NPDC049730]|uniref:hypothetical protein n=1 Tax=Micromonospora sp. NPDC049730 TaxID=3154836 RepID=UPI00340ACEDC
MPGSSCRSVNRATSPSVRISTGKSPFSSTRSIFTWSSRMPCTRSTIDQRTFAQPPRRSVCETTAEIVRTWSPAVNRAGRPPISVANAACAGAARVSTTPALPATNAPSRSAYRHTITTTSFLLVPVGKR